MGWTGRGAWGRGPGLAEPQGREPFAWGGRGRAPLTTSLEQRLHSATAILRVFPPHTQYTHISFPSGRPPLALLHRRRSSHHLQHGHDEDPL